MNFKKKTHKETIQRHRFGNFELRISEVKCEVEDAVNKLTKHVYNVGSFEYGLFSFLLSPVKADGKVNVPKTDKEVTDGLANVEFLVVLLIHTNLIFSNDVFRQKYYELIQEMVKAASPVEISKEADDKILDELKLVDSMKTTVAGE